MQFPRYELVWAVERERVAERHRPRPRRTRPLRPPRDMRRMVPRRRSEPVLGVHEYLELEFAVDERR